MANDFIEIANSAITKVGGAQIMSLDDDTKEAKACKLRLDPCRRIVLRMHPWNCAIDRVDLAPLIDAPVSEYTTLFQLPADCLRVLDIDPDVKYRIEGRTILSNSSAIALRYVRNLVDPTIIDELLGEAIACYLAWDTAYAITQKNTVQDAIWRQFMLIMRQAKSVDAQEERDYEVEANELLESRISSPTVGRSNR